MLGVASRYVTREWLDVASKVRAIDAARTPTQIVCALLCAAAQLYALMQVQLLLRLFFF